MSSSNAQIASLSPQEIEGLARVVIVLENGVWLEPEQGTSCAGCASLAACGAKGMGTIASRLEARRFFLPQPPDSVALRLGERVVVGVAPTALWQGSLAAYGLPLAGVFVAGGVAEAAFGHDGLTMLACLVGLFAGVCGSALWARRLQRRGRLSPQFLRRAGVGVVCSTGEKIA